VRLNYPTSHLLFLTGTERIRSAGVREQRGKPRHEYAERSVARSVPVNFGEFTSQHVVNVLLSLAWRSFVREHGLALFFARRRRTGIYVASHGSGLRLPGVAGR